jgi:hypothetical protein
MKLDNLLGRRGAGRSWRDRLAWSSGPMDDALCDPIAPVLALPPPGRNARARAMSPRQLAEWAHEQYFGGTLTWEEYRVAGFHAELHPDYNATVGALTGQPAMPDRPRDMIREWEERLAFHYRHSTPGDPQIRRIEKILLLLGRTEPTPPTRADRPF